jgi:hypothetical protein
MKATRSHLVREIFEIVLFLFRRKLKEMPQFIALQDSKFNEALIQNMKHEALSYYLVVGIVHSLAGNIRARHYRSCGTSWVRTSPLSASPASSTPFTTSASNEFPCSSNSFTLSL